MIIAKLVLLGVGVAGAVARPRGLPAWVAPTASVALALGLGLVAPAQAGRALRPLVDPLAFLLVAVPLAVLLDRVGLFESLAGTLTGGRRVVPGLWGLAAAATTVLNLDASVVLLTPLYVRVARRTGLCPRAIGFQPVLLACLASSALPVSNLTNLIAAARTGARPASFVAHLALPSLVATVVGYWCYRRALPPGRPEGLHRQAPDRRALALGGTVVVLVLAGFVTGPRFGVAPWEVAMGADVVLILATSRLGRTRLGRTRLGRACAGVSAPPDTAWRPAIPWGAIPWGAIPWGTALVAATLAVLAEAAVAHLAVGQLIGGVGPVAEARTAAVAAVGANVVNNLPALLLALPSLARGPSCVLWAVLIGVNMGPTLLVTGSLASLLWLDSMKRLGVKVTARDYSRVGVRVGLPALLAAAGVLLALSTVAGCS